MRPMPPRFPSRLRDAGDATAALILRALEEPVVGPTEERSWRKLREPKPRPVHTRWLVPSVAFAVAVAVTISWFGRSEPELSVTPDRIPIRSMKAAPEEVVEPTPAAERPAPLPSTTSKRAESRAASEPRDANAPCAGLAQAGQYERALDCYGRVARSDGVAAELALYEKARLEAKALGRNERALATLDEHVRRYPAGMLSSEVGLTRIELLSRLGRRSEALSAIDAAFSRALGRERGADLQVLRAELLAAQGDCGAASKAARAAQGAGVHPSRLAGVERRCGTDGLMITNEP